MAETAGDGTSIRYLYDADGTLTGLITNGVTYYYVKDAQGDIMAIVDGQGVVKARYAYTAYGAVTVNDEPGTDIGTRNPYRYRGYCYDSETGLYYVSSRY